jgi:hypothetical protein
MKSLPSVTMHKKVTQWLQFLPIIFICLAPSTRLLAQTGPFYPTNWPPTIDTNSMAVDYYIVDPSAVFDTPPGWNPTITFSGGGDQAFVSATRDGLVGDASTSSFMNIADTSYTQFGTVSNVDILLQVFGNDALYNGNGTGKTITFREGALGTELPVSAGPIPAGANNGHWNWMLFSITNAINPHPQNTTGIRYIGFVPTPAPPGTQNGGVNGGTLRIEGIPGVLIRAVAVGPAGVFGTTNVVNAVFQSPVVCSPEPPVNLAYIDINAGVTNHLIVLTNDTDQTVVYQTGIGPAGDLRKAIQGTSLYMNFGILSNYLGEPCNTPRAMKVCLEFYDDPALAGLQFGPESFAVDSTGATAPYTGPLYTMTGSGQWLKVAFWIPSVNLFGVNTAPYTGGPRLTGNAFPFIDRIELGIVRAGTNALAGLDPDSSYLLNPLICTTNYGYYVELDLQHGITNGLTTGNSGGDQNMVVELAGPPSDQRLSLAPTGGNNNLQFAIIPGASAVPPLGPTYQDNADVVMALTYYDDPAMVGARLYPWPYQTLRSGVTAITFPNQLTGTSVFGTPYSYRETLTGSGTWKVAYFELPNVNLAGVNQGPQSVARFQTDPATNGVPASGYIHVSRVRYNVVRPCGPYVGIDMFQPVGITNSAPRPTVGWLGQATLQATPTLGGVWTDLLSVTNNVKNSYTPPTLLPLQFFRLKFPRVPPLP